MLVVCAMCHGTGTALWPDVDRPCGGCNGAGEVEVVLRVRSADEAELAELRAACGYDPDRDVASIDELITYKDALEDRLREGA